MFEKLERAGGRSDGTYVDHGVWWNDRWAAVLGLEKGMDRVVWRDQECALKEDADDTTGFSLGLPNPGLEFWLGNVRGYETAR